MHYKIYIIETEPLCLVCTFVHGLTFITLIRSCVQINSRGVIYNIIIYQHIVYNSRIPRTDRTVV